MTREDKIRFLVFRSVGNFFVIFTIFAVISFFGPALYYEIRFKVIQARGVTYSVQEDTKTGFGKILEEKGLVSGNSGGFAEVLAGPRQQVLSAKDPEFSILIPKIGASSRVIPNVDPQDEGSFIPALKQGVAHAKGTVFPGIKGNTYLFAHSTDDWWNVGSYNAVFYLLKDLKVGEDVIVFFQNKRYNYKISETRIVDPTDVSFIVKSQEQTEELLILQTCWPPGTTWKRLIVIAKPI